jgi:hypothetical protein
MQHVEHRAELCMLSLAVAVHKDTFDNTPNNQLLSMHCLVIDKAVKMLQIVG